jgi:hypothetical protein
VVSPQLTGQPHAHSARHMPAPECTRARHVLRAGTQPLILMVLIISESGPRSPTQPAQAIDWTSARARIDENTEYAVL